MKLKNLKLVAATVLLLAATTCALRAADAEKLDLASARDLALKTHPRVTIAELRALAAKEEITVARSAYLPQISGDAIAVGVGETLTRLGAGQLTSSQVYDRVGAGLIGSQLITDFGRTNNLTSAAKNHAKAAEADVIATRAQLTLDVDGAYFGALRARSLKTVATKTLAARQTLLDQVRALAGNQLRSSLDLQFAQVRVDEARLLVDQADGDWDAALAVLSSLIGHDLPSNTELAEDTSTIEEVPADPLTSIQLAMRQRPELVRRSAEKDAAYDNARAAREARLPKISAMGVAGVVPIRDEHFSHDYAVGALDVSVPLFAGGMYRSRQREAELLARAQDAQLKDEESLIARSVHVAWLDAIHSRQRIELTDHLLTNARQAFQLTNARFGQGLSSSVELNVAELAETSAEVARASAEYEYRIRRSLLAYQTGSLNASGPAPAATPVKP